MNAAHKMKRLGATFVFCAIALWAGNAAATSILFIGNSFTYGYGSPVRHFHADSVTDLNGEGVGGVPALFKAFTLAAGLDFDVYLETHGDVGLDWHVDNKRAVIGSKPWDIVVMQGYSTLDPRKPGDPARLIGSAKRMTALLKKGNPATDIRLIATWPRADMVYPAKGAWHGKSLDAMAQDVRAGNEKAAAAIPAIKGVIPVGAAWIRAINAGFADANPYDGLDAGKVDLWARDHHHGSTFGYYLDALVLFGAITGRDPRTLGDGECTGLALGISAAQISALQRFAYEQLAADATLSASQNPVAAPATATRCAR